MSGLARLGRWSVALGWALFITWAATCPGESLPDWQAPGLDKLVHVLLYLVLGALVFRASQRVRWATLLGAAHGGLVEWLQLRVSGRTAEWLDLAADVAGACLGAWLLSRRRS